ncbi:hypothetical protein GCM10008937_28230 [Deinococcus depolymerans]|uniref:Secreted protein n=1 Tax=Deinococcus depolymerans TaxID=392408 RepID=A0ABP3MHF3_9DEIO
MSLSVRVDGWVALGWAGGVGGGWVFPVPVTSAKLEPSTICHAGRVCPQVTDLNRPTPDTLTRNPIPLEAP